VRTSRAGGAKLTDTYAAPAGGAKERAQAIRRGGVALIANGAATGVLGIAFWVVAARLFGEVALGQNAALIAGMSMVSGLSQLNYTRSLSSLIPSARSGAVRLVGRVYLVVSIVSLVLGALFAAILPEVSSRYSYLRPASLAIPGFALAVAIWSIFTLEDTVLASARKASLVPVENGFFGLAKLGLLFVLAAVKGGDLSIFLAWVLPLVFIVTPINIYNFRRALPALANLPVEPAPTTERWVKFDFAGYMFWVVGTSSLPFLVLGFLGPIKAAGFYLPLTMASTVDLVTMNVGNAITAEVTRNGGRVDRHAARFIVGYWFLVLAGSLLFIVLAPQLMAIFGRHYKSGSAMVFRLLLGASAARAAMFLMNALSRAAGKGGRILLVQATASILTLGIGLTLMPQIGTKGMAIGWLVGSLTAGVIALWWLVPSIIGGLRSTESTDRKRSWDPLGILDVPADLAALLALSTPVTKTTGRARPQSYSPRHSAGRPSAGRRGRTHATYSSRTW
jgi:O-antigen/teichoic acid export membrane protein